MDSIVWHVPSISISGYCISHCAPGLPVVVGVVVVVVGILYKQCVSWKRVRVALLNQAPGALWKARLLYGEVW